MQKRFFNRKLFLVDDDEATRFLVNEIFDNTNISIIEAASSKQAISLFREHSRDIDLILLDIFLPDNGGISLLKQLHRMNPFVPAIAISALDPAQLAKQCLYSGFSSFISKPFDIEDFYNTVTRSVRAYKADTSSIVDNVIN